MLVPPARRPFDRLLRSAAAIHLAVALRLQVDGIVAYDIELGTAATAVGLQVVRPGS